MGHEHEIEIREALAGLRRELHGAEDNGQVLKSVEKAGELYLRGVGMYLKDRHVGNKIIGGVMAAATPFTLPLAVVTSALEATLFKEPKKKSE